MYKKHVPKNGEIYLHYIHSSPQIYRRVMGFVTIYINSVKLKLTEST